MAFFPDLSPHTYSPTRGLKILNVGWLDEGNVFPVGHTSQRFQDALAELCQRPIILHRGVHGCWFCGPNKKCGNGQIRVFARTGIGYAAPTLVHHYVVDHDYLPPLEFVEAVLSPFAIGTERLSEKGTGPLNAARRIRTCVEKTGVLSPFRTASDYGWRGEYERLRWSS
jgi:hypothetical protein